jgi:hypothetical protein
VQRAFEELCRAEADKALAVLLEVMADKDASPSARITAANTVLDRGYGKAVGRDVLLNLSGGPDGERVSDAELLRIVQGGKPSEIREIGEARQGERPPPSDLKRGE